MFAKPQTSILLIAKVTMKEIDSILYRSFKSLMTTMLVETVRQRVAQALADFKVVLCRCLLCVSVNELSVY